MHGTSQENKQASSQAIQQISACACLPAIERASQLSGVSRALLGMVQAREPPSRCTHGLRAQYLPPTLHAPPSLPSFLSPIAKRHCRQRTRHGSWTQSGKSRCPMPGQEGGSRSSRAHQQCPRHQQPNRALLHAPLQPKKTGRRIECVPHLQAPRASLCVPLI